MTRSLAIAGIFTFFLCLIAATPQMLAANTTCNGSASTPNFPGGPWTLNCAGTCPNAAVCGAFSWRDGNTTHSQCTCGNFVPIGDTECFFTLNVTRNPDGSTTTTATCVNFNCAAPKTCVDVASGRLGGAGTFSCECKAPAGGGGGTEER